MSSVDFSTFQQISGFTIIRNAKNLSYPFRQSILSLLPICAEVIINCGNSEDDTLEVCTALEKEFPQKIRLIHSIWEKHESAGGGKQLKLQTDRALQKCTQNWCFYLQADEVLHEESYKTIFDSILQANAYPQIDGIVFDYLHFYGNYNHTIQGRGWYRKEVRLFKNHRNITAFRDAQGFRKNGQKLWVLSSPVSIFHYGHVRKKEELKAKIQEMSHWWNQTPFFDWNQQKPTNHVGVKKFCGSHPIVMKQLIEKNVEYMDPSLSKTSWTWKEFNDMFTLLWEKVFSFRPFEFRNYQIFDIT